MFDWLFRKSPHGGLPYYKVLERNQHGRNRRDFSDLEKSPEIDRLSTQFRSELLSQPRRPKEDQPLLTSFITGPASFFTIRLPNSIPCLLCFSSPIRAAAYARTHARALRLKYLSSSSQQFAQMLGELRHSRAIQDFAMDVCPHCLTFPAIQIKELMTPDDILKIWSICKSAELARESLYFTRAKEAADRGDQQEAREIALEAIQHMTMESARLHLLLGQIAVSLKDKDLLRDARAFLEFLHAEQSLRELHSIEQSGTG
jgi:hypothetical protein